MANLVIPVGQYFDTDNVISVKVPAGQTLSDGAILVASVLDTATGNDVYAATVPAAVTDDYLCMVVGDEFYEDSQGNRLGVSDPTQITYKAGNIVRAYRLVKSRRFKISDGAITGTPVIGQFLIPTAASTTLTAAATVGTAKYAFMVEKLAVNVSYAGLTPVTGVIARLVVAE